MAKMTVSHESPDKHCSPITTPSRLNIVAAVGFLSLIRDARGVALPGFSAVVAKAGGFWVLKSSQLDVDLKRGVFLSCSF